MKSSVRSKTVYYLVMLVVALLCVHSLAFAGKKDDTQIVIKPIVLTDITKKHPQLSEQSIQKFKSVMTKRKIVDAFRYQTMFRFQYHPQYTYDDLNTSLIFKFIVEELVQQKIKK